MRQRGKGPTRFGESVLTVDDDDDFRQQDEANYCANEGNADLTGSTNPLAMQVGDDFLHNKERTMAMVCIGFGSP